MVLLRALDPDRPAEALDEGGMSDDEIECAKALRESYGMDLPRSATLTDAGATLNCGGEMAVGRFIKEVQARDPKAKVVRDYGHRPWFHCADNEYIQALYSFLIISFGYAMRL